MERKTFREVRAELCDYLESAGWKVELNSARAPWAPLKVPRATSRDGRTVLSFRTQAVYKGEHSLVSDMREVDGPTLVRLALHEYEDFR